MHKIAELPFVAYPVANDLPRVRAFYEGLLGLKQATSWEDSEGFWVEYGIGASTLALCTYWKPSSAPSMAPAIAFEVEDFPAAVAELKTANITFTMEPLETPGCFMCVVLDPDGNSLFIHHRKPGRN